MTTTVQSVIQRAQETLQDLAGVQWPATELVRHLNDGQRQLIVARPDVGSITASFVPVAGARQSLPATAIALISVRNNSAGNKRAIRIADGAVLDAFSRDWRSMAGVTEFAHYLYSMREPRVFDLYPPAALSASIEVTHSAYPTDAPAPSGAAYTTATGSMSVPDIWDNTILNYVLSRAYAKNAEFGGNAQLSGAYMAAFVAVAGVQLKSSAMVAPKT